MATTLQKTLAAAACALSLAGCNNDDQVQDPKKIAYFAERDANKALLRIRDDNIVQAYYKENSDRFSACAHVLAKPQEELALKRPAPTTRETQPDQDLATLARPFIEQVDMPRILGKLEFIQPCLDMAAAAYKDPDIRATAFNSTLHKIRLMELNQWRGASQIIDREAERTIAGQEKMFTNFAQQNRRAVADLKPHASEPVFSGPAF